MTALAPLTKVKASAQFFAYGAIPPRSTLTVVLEVPQDAVAGRPLA
jgi:hypothetical protein